MKKIYLIVIFLKIIFCLIFYSCSNCEMLLLIKNNKNSSITVYSTQLIEPEGKDSLNHYYRKINPGGSIQLIDMPFCDFEASALPSYLSIVTDDTVLIYTNHEELAKMFHCEGKMKGDRCKSGTWVYEVK